jgi:acyl dehydratase
VPLIVHGDRDLRSLAGSNIPPTEWIEIDQSRIDEFARATNDAQWIHVDKERAAAGPFGRTIAHGFLTLSLIPYFWDKTVCIEGFAMNINYGLNKVRFPAPVPVGSRMRARFSVPEVSEVEGGFQVIRVAMLEVEEIDKPACVAETVLRLYL